MGKSKYAPALFEVIGTQRDKKKGLTRLSLPRWWSGQKEDDQAAVEDEPSVAEAISPAEEPPPARTPVAPLAQAPTRPPIALAARHVTPPVLPTPPLFQEVSGSPHPVLRLASGRVELSLSAVNAVVVACGLLLALLCSYELGRRVGPSAASPTSLTGSGEPSDGDLDVALKKPINPRALDVGSGTSVGRRESTAEKRHPAQPAVGPAAAGTGTPPAPAKSAGKRTAGLNYVIIESFKPEHHEDALHAQKWLAGKDVAATVERRGDRWELVSEAGFNYADPAQKQQCQGFQKYVQSLGEKYKQEFPGKIRYSFLSPAVRKWEQ